MLNILPPLIFSPVMASIMGTMMSPLGGNETGEGNLTIEHVLTLLTVTISQIIRKLADAMKNKI